MVDVSKRLSGSPKVQPKPNLGKKWMSVPNLLSDDEDESWIKEQDNMEEDGVSFAEEVPELSLVHINKQRVQLRPKRRPPSRDHVKSRASMDFDLFMVEEITEEDEDVGQDEATEDKETKVERSPVKPAPPPKPSGSNGWRLPTPTSEVVLKKTKPNHSPKAKQHEMKESEIKDNINDVIPESSPEKKQKERKGFKRHFLKFRRSRRGRPNAKAQNIEPKTNLTATYAVSVDSGNRPLGEDSRRPRPNRRSRKSDEKGLNWLLGLFHKRNAPADTGEPTNVAGNVPTGHATGNHGDSNSNGKEERNRTVQEVTVEGELTNGHTSHEEGANQDSESVSDLTRKFERISAAF